MKSTIIETDSKKQTVTKFTIEAPTKDELFGLFFRKYRNKYKYIHYLYHEFENEALAAQFKEWIADVNNYANNGGDMW